MQGSFLRFYVHEGQRHQRRLLWEWLLEQANALGIRGGSAFRAMAGFGRHHVLHESKFFELAGTLAVEVEFLRTRKPRNSSSCCIGKASDSSMPLCRPCSG